MDSLGRIASINITDPGENYNLEQTVVSVRDALGGVGFSASAIRFPFDSGVGGGRSGGGYSVLKCCNTEWATECGRQYKWVGLIFKFRVTV